MPGLFPLKFPLFIGTFCIQVFPNRSEEPIALDECTNYQEATENADIEEDYDDECQNAFDDGNGVFYVFQLDFHVQSGITKNSYEKSN